MWLKCSQWSHARFLGQELVLGAASRGASGEAWEELGGILRGSQVLSHSSSSSGCFAQIFGLKIRLENFERSPFP